MDIIIGPVFRLFMMAIDLYIWIVLIGVILSWLAAMSVINMQNRFVYMVTYSIHRITEPLLRPIRRILPDMGSFDLSPVALIFILIFAKDLLVQVLIKFG